MTKKQYFTIIKIADDILKCDKTSFSYIIPWLHIVREHPVYLEQYNKIFEDRFFYKLIIYLKYSKDFLALFYVLFKSINYRNH